MDKNEPPDASAEPCCGGEPGKDTEAGGSCCCSGGEGQASKANEASSACCGLSDPNSCSGPSCDCGTQPAPRSSLKTLVSTAIILAAVGVGAYSLLARPAAAPAGKPQGTGAISPKGSNIEAAKSGCCAAGSAEATPEPSSCCGGKGASAAPAQPSEAAPQGCCGAAAAPRQPSCGEVGALPTATAEPSCGAAAKGCCGH